MRELKEDLQQMLRETSESQALIQSMRILEESFEISNA